VSALASDPAIVTDSGPLKGVVTPQITSYLGIPYAAPPVGTLRWMPPQPFGRWQGVFDATQVGNKCPQTRAGDENCLVLNVYTPTAAQGKPDRLPVMVWIHGGGLTGGAGSEFDPTPLVEGGGVIVVTINYRLGVLGFLAHPALDREGHLAGNYGLMDQQFALAWVQRNIAAFGGDTTRVTIFGESAGGLSVYSQLASPRAAGLFQAAIAQSGAYSGFAAYRTTIVPLAVAETTGDAATLSGTALADAVGCRSQTAECLRSVAATMLVDKQRVIYPFIDGTLLTETPGAAFASGDFNRVPVMTGTTHDEYRYFVARDFNLNSDVGPITNAQYPAALTTVFGAALATSVLAQYPLPSNPPADAASLALGAAGTDGYFACTARRAMQGLAPYVTTYAYEFNDTNAPSPEIPAVNFPLGAFHSSDVQYLFNRLGVPAPFTPAQTRLSQAMIDYWIHFATTGDPNSTSQPVWTPYHPATDLRLSLTTPQEAVESTFATDHRCAFWDRF
jgi:para-nitrobenzyl esterase